MKTLQCIIITFALLLSGNILSQTKYGNVTMDELNMNVYPQDTTASAVVLLRKGTTYFTYDDRLFGFQYKYTLETKIKILKPDGLTWCTDKIEYTDQGTNEKERIDGLSGTTYNLENGKIVKTKLSKEFISEESVNDTWIVRKFTMPAAKVGSVIEYKYTIVSDFIFSLPQFEFQLDIPVAETSYEITLPEYFRFNLNSSGYERVETKKEPVNERFSYNYRDGNGMLRSDNVHCTADKYTFKGKDIPALKDEPFLWAKEDYRSKVKFEISSLQMPYSKPVFYNVSWANVDEQYAKASSFGGNLKKAGMFKEEVKPMEATIDNAREILNIIRYKVKWDDKSSAFPSNINDAWKKGLGSSADMNFLLINALKAGGFDAYPVLLSTRSHGRVPMGNASRSAFNYVIAAVKLDTVMYYTDAAAEYGDWNLLPEKCMVEKARVFNDKNSYWVDLSTISSGMNYTTSQYKFVDGLLQGNINRTSRGNMAIDFKNFYFNEHKDKNEYIEKLANRLSAQIENFDIQNEMNTNADLKLSYTLKTDISTGDDHIYINPLLIKHYNENPFKSETRIFPINFDYAQSYIHIAEIEIPEGYVVDELPKSEIFVTGDKSPIKLTYQVAHMDNKIKIHYQYSLKNLLFLPTEYDILRDFFGKIVLKNSEQIVLKKASEV